MSPAERIALREALASADFSRSPGLRNRLRRALYLNCEWMPALTIAFALGCWITTFWLLFGE